MCVCAYPPIQSNLYLSLSLSFSLSFPTVLHYKYTLSTLTSKHRFSSVQTFFSVFKFAIDFDGLYGSDHFAAKSAGLVSLRRRLTHSQSFTCLLIGIYFLISSSSLSSLSLSLHFQPPFISLPLIFSHTLSYPLSNSSFDLPNHRSWWQ